MSKKKKTKKPSSKSAVRPPADQAAAPEASWPADLPEPRRLLLIGGAVTGSVLVLFLLALTNNLIWVKRIIAHLIGLPNPDLYVKMAQSWDIALVIFLIAGMVGAGLRHPCLGLAVLVFCRIWFDGYTYPVENAYFLWGALAIFALWGSRTLLRGERIENKTPILLFAAFLGVSLAFWPFSYQFDATYKQIMLWFAYFALFVISANALKSRVAIGTVVGALLCAMALQAAYSVLHFELVLPGLRLSAQDPDLLQKYFGTRVVTPELTRRLMMNRAFGTFLFPNALAGFLLLGIPLAFAGAITGWRAFAPVWRAARNRPPMRGAQWLRRRYTAIALGGAIWLLGVLSFFIVGMFIKLYNADGLSSWYLNDNWIAVLSALLALIPAFFFFRYADRGGPVLFFLALRAYGLAATAPLSLYVLWITYSRGGWLALAAGAVFSALLYSLDRKNLPGILKRFVPAAAALLLVGGLWMTAARVDQAAAQTPMNPAADTTSPEFQRNAQALHAEGMDITLGNLADTRTFGLRLSYWRVGMRMFIDNPWTGVGLGCFPLAYTRYQGPLDGDVKEAHNGYLQCFCEGGVADGALFAAFWTYFAIWGAWRILREENRFERLTLAGLYAGVIAFLLHAGIDVHFSHPSLAMLAFVMAGSFYARSNLTSEPGVSDAPSPSPAKRIGGGAGMLVLLLCTAVVAGMSVRTYLQDFALSRGSVVNMALQGQTEYLTRLRIALRFISMQPTAEKAAQTTLGEALTLPMDLDDAKDLGRFYVRLPDNPTSARPLQAGDQLTAETVILVDSAQKAVDYGEKGLEKWLDELIMIDSLFPYNPEVAYNIADGYKMLFIGLRDRGEAQERWHPDILKCVEWSKVALKRGPMDPRMHMLYAGSQWSLGRYEKGEARDSAFEACLEQARRACELSPAQPVYFDYYAQFAHIMALNFEEDGLKDRAAAYEAQSKELREKWRVVGETRWKHGLP